MAQDYTGKEKTVLIDERTYTLINNVLHVYTVQVRNERLLGRWHRARMFKGCTMIDMARARTELKKIENSL